MTMHDILPLLPVILACFAALLTAGIVKGVIAVGLPLVGLPLLMLSVDVQTGISLLIVPLILSNLIQAIEGEGTGAIFRRFWPLLLALVVGTFIGTALFSFLNHDWLLLAIGVLAITFSMIGFLTPGLAVPARFERMLNGPIGLASGIIGGLSTLYGPILAIYLTGLNLPRDLFVKVISIFYTVAAAALLASGASQGGTGWHEFLLSCLTMIPVYGGMLIGQRIRHLVNPDAFRKLVLGIVWLTGANLIRMGLGY
jgi:uncharacterized membrane protein YfcA